MRPLFRKGLGSLPKGPLGLGAGAGALRGAGAGALTGAGTGAESGARSGAPFSVRPAAMRDTAGLCRGICTVVHVVSLCACAAEVQPSRFMTPWSEAMRLPYQLAEARLPCL